MEILGDEVGEGLQVVKSCCQGTLPIHTRSDNFAVGCIV